MRTLTLSALLALCPLALWAQDRTLTSGDSALVGRILLAEDRRDTADPALTEGRRNEDARIRRLAERAVDRIVDSSFTKRSSFTPLRAPTRWPEAAWRLRYRALADHRDDCTALDAAVTDSAWPVRLHAADVARASCAGDATLLATLRAWMDSMPADVSRRPPGGVSWHAAAHALVAMSRLSPDAARHRLAHFATHENQYLRLYAARSAALLRDTLTLRTLAGDTDPNVRESAIDALAKLTGHGNDAIFLSALEADAPQVVRAAAMALVGSPDSTARGGAAAAFERWVARANASERDVRVALLQAAGRPATDDRPPALLHALPPSAVSLALGADVRVRVTMAPSSGSGSFVVRLRGDAAPMTAARILVLVRQGYYNGLTWHRVEPDFVIQGGGPLNNEYSGYRHYFRDELSSVSHLRGTVGMSTRAHDTGDAQWFVNLRDNPRLDHDYTVFGEVVTGMDVVDGILEGDIISNMSPVTR
jgi:cyclophilin family peptidyl-prolyl cis-trans isomerase